MAGHDGWAGSTKLGLASWLPVAALCAGLLCGATQAGAQQQGPAYQTLVDEALQEFGAGNWIEAYNLFQQAHVLDPSARTERGMGMAAYEMRKYAVAMEHLQRSLASRVRQLNAEQRSHVEGLVSRAQRLVGTLDLQVQPPTAEVFVNGAPWASGRSSVAVGDLVIRVTAEGYREAERRVTVMGGQSQAVEIKLTLLTESATPLPAAAPAAAPLAPASAPAAPLAVPADPAGPRSGTAKADTPVLPWVLIGIGGTLFASSLITGMMANSKADDLDGKCFDDTDLCDDSVAGAADSGRSLALITDILWPAGLVAAGIGTVLLLTSGDDTEEQPPASASLGCIPGACAASMKVRF